uniref:Uncharacterized protein n=1 Tax=Anguilla anguilla TaxID=7936 RepID=A0A0E9UWJ0_ANGAN
MDGSLNAMKRIALSQWSSLLVLESLRVKLPVNLSLYHS